MLAQITEVTSDPILDIILDTLKKGKQAIVFVNTKRSAEAAAEKIGQKIKDLLRDHATAFEMADRVETALSSPTKQCRRLAKVVRQGAAFHHSGLHSTQREIIEEGFRSGKTKVICATPTLAAGVDLPAFRVIIRDLKRYGGSWGMTSIQVLEYEQMSGRAGRPSFDNEGQAICIADSNEEKERIWSEYVEGEPEEILSKLAVEPVLRTYILSLVSAGYVSSWKSLKEFMASTFYAKQFGDLAKLNSILEKMVFNLNKWGFIHAEVKKQETGFVSAAKLGKTQNPDYPIEATEIGTRVAELYLDPLTAHTFLESIKTADNKKPTDFSFIHLISWSLEIRPYFSARQKDTELINEALIMHGDNFLREEPDEYSDEYEEFLDSVKTAIVLYAWMNESTEEELLETYNVTPGELGAKLDRADWLLHACYELSRLEGKRDVANAILKTQTRLRAGVKEELMPLIKLKNVGRVRARKLFNNGIKDLGDVKKIDVSVIAQILGKSIAVDIKKQVGQEVSESKLKVKPNKRKGQISLHDFSQ